MQQTPAFSEPDPIVLADLLDAAAASLCSAVTELPADVALVTANGVAMIRPMLLAICLGEQLIHGLNLARAAGRPFGSAADLLGGPR